MTRQNEKGFSYLEIMISLIIIGVVIVPVGSAMVNATKTQIKAKTLYEATKGAEMLMQEIESDLDNLIAEKISQASLEQEGLFDKVKTGQTPGDLVEMFKLDEKKYGMERGQSHKGLVYDVAIWDMSQMISKQNLQEQLIISFSQPETAMKLPHTMYLDEAIRLQSEPLTALEPVTEEELKFQEQMNLEYQFNPQEEFMVFEQTEPLREGQTSFSGAAVLEVSEDEGDVNIVQKNYMGIKHEGKANFRISGPTSWSEVHQPKGMVEYTLFPLQKEEKNSYEELVIFIDTANVKGENIVAIKLINETQKHVVIKIIGTNHQAVALLPEAKKGNISIQRDTTYGVTNNYVIGIVIRDKAQAGKIVKKTIGLYAYD